MVVLVDPEAPVVPVSLYVDMPAEDFGETVD